MSDQQDIVEELKTIITKNNWETDFTNAIKAAHQENVKTLDEYYNWLKEFVVWIPNDSDSKKSLYNTVCEYYWYLAQPSVKHHQQNSELSNWIVKFANTWGKFLDTTKSAEHIDSFRNRPELHIEDYAKSPSGWLTFNQFFARQIKPGKRPIDHLDNDSIIVSPADSVPVECNVIHDNKIITAKGFNFNILELLKDSPYKKDFDGGLFMHTFLSDFDYHRYHVPVSGKVLEIRNILGNAYMDVTKSDDGEFHMVDGTGYQFTQARGLVVLDSPIGKVAILPIGMAQASSIVITPEKDSILHKGQEFGYFQFGGSDIVILFSKDCNVEITAKIDGKTHYNQGQKIGQVKNS